jgi:hypothetical protein
MRLLYAASYGGVAVLHVATQTWTAHHRRERRSACSLCISLSGFQSSSVPWRVLVKCPLGYKLDHPTGLPFRLYHQPPYALLLAFLSLLFDFPTPQGVANPIYHQTHDQAVRIESLNFIVFLLFLHLGWFSWKCSIRPPIYPNRRYCCLVQQ